MSCNLRDQKWSVLGTGITSSFVIPVPRHWDPGNLIASNALDLVSMGFML
ncbi:hypothetical protein wCauA_03170 [Wolbachia endosymbiont of Carposina sasakii]|uniref:Uncharacterized protein n=1 Tax=Wolbachia pipientis TaxID=955 RepID=A0A6I6CLP2_WOLPI|nr:hypothetical protein DEF52_00325 [Wolbachia endosymbiont of Nasonia oneida]NGZ19444.1 hypothetical protein [Wolbachia pipientis]QDH19315.1 hypothetical protein wCauA_03170 [Wolbachia endosymbiont of Carposina sasakii]QGT16959.1 hypothetical protein E0495_04500 [Wolbachia pipientis]TLW85445.1 hypothetical protein FFT12_03435 [Wolbachia endosymbiont of Drosophila teissieri]